MCPTPAHQPNTLIVVSYDQRTVGSTVTGCSDPHGVDDERIRLHVLREATEAEYEVCLLALGGSRRVYPFYEPVWFYEVAVD